MRLGTAGCGVGALTGAGFTATGAGLGAITGLGGKIDAGAEADIAASAANSGFGSTNSPCNTSSRRLMMKRVAQ